MCTYSTRKPILHLQRPNPTPHIPTIPPNTIAYPPPHHSQNILPTPHLLQSPAQRLQHLELSRRNDIRRILRITPATNKVRKSRCWLKQ
jgi:hypothetical protein